RHPLAIVWESKITAKYGDGRCVGGGGAVVVALNATDLRCLSLADGRPRWERDGCRERESPVVLAGPFVWGRIERNDEDGSIRLSRIDLATGSSSEHVSAVGLGAQGVGSHRGRQVIFARYGRIAVDGAFFEEAPPLFGRMQAGRCYTVPRPAANGSLDAGVACVEMEDDREVWRVPSDDGKTEYVVSVSEELLVSFSFGGELRARSPKDGRLLWRSSTENSWDTLAPVVIASGHVFHWESRVLRALRVENGEVAWTREVPGERTNVIATRGALWVGLEGADGGHRLTALDPSTGATLWETRVAARLAGRALHSIDDRLVCIVGRKLVCFAHG
ncbi:MAG TPA: PQQ-binding-like beta-propeller repeat protein, partial [Planctomycetota bacterium]|nr:PQQ-binding-like beta-propeller repeat protein [Planctomycetota bacterium]